MVTELAVKTPLNRLRARPCWEMLGDFKSFLPAKCRKAGLHWGSKQRYLDHTSTNFWSVWKASKLYIWIAGKNDHDWWFKWSWMIRNDQKGIHCKPTVAHLWVASTNVSPPVELGGFGFDFTRWVQGPAKWNCPFGPFLGAIVDKKTHNSQKNSHQVFSSHINENLGFIWFYNVLYIVCANQQPHHSPQLKTRMMTSRAVYAASQVHRCGLVAGRCSWSSALSWWDLWPRFALADRPATMVDQCQPPFMGKHRHHGDDLHQTIWPTLLLPLLLGCVGLRAVASYFIPFLVQRQHVAWWRIQLNKQQ